MTKSKWEVWTLDFPGKGPHPVVLISHPDRCARGAAINGLFCTSQRQSRSIRPYEVMLNGADGLSWETFCACDVIYAFDSERLYQRRGIVSPARRRAIRSKLVSIFNLLGED
jgi:mRNA-degrading endonuclease toxin of MazEF toxin-antitoxin module